ncbi:MAG: hypothetical protein ABIZ34_08930, partial [Candidatus Limnocylindrales bacterium]
MRRRACTDAEFALAMLNLGGDANPIAARDWPADLQDLDMPGLYSWWADDVGTRALALGLGVELDSGRSYAGQTGATKWPS